MSIRVYAGPWVNVAVPPAPPLYRSKLSNSYIPPLTAFVNYFPSKSDGSPASSWVITFGRSADWVAVEADPEMIDLFAGDLPSAIQNRGDFVAFLRARTVSDVPAARRATIQANLDTLGIPRADFTGGTKLWKVFQRVVSTLFEKDDNFGAGFNL